MKRGRGRGEKKEVKQEHEWILLNSTYYLIAGSLNDLCVAINANPLGSIGLSVNRAVEKQLGQSISAIELELHNMVGRLQVDIKGT